MTNTIKDDDIISNIRKDKLNNINNLTQILRKDTESTLDSQMENSQKNSNENLPFVNLTPTLSFEDDENQKIILNIPEKTNPLRLNYYSKLIQNGIWYKEKMKNSFNSLFILDWDDTLFCTSEVANLNDLEDNNNLSKSQKVKFSKLEGKTEGVLGVFAIVLIAIGALILFSVIAFFVHRAIKRKDNSSSGDEGETRDEKLIQ